MDKAEVLNGWVKAGDIVAYATRHGSWQDMNIGSIIEVDEIPHPWRTERTIKRLKVNVVETSGYHSVPRHVTLTVLDRVVRLNAMPS